MLSSCLRCPFRHLRSSYGPCNGRGRARTFSRGLYDELYVPDVLDRITEWWKERQAETQTAGEDEPEPPTFPVLRFIIAGFSRGRVKPEVWEVFVAPDGTCPEPTLAWQEDASGVVTFRGQSEALTRLLFGYTTRTLQKLINLGVPESEAMNLLVDFAPPAHAAMPIQDALDLVDFLANTTSSFTRFLPGHPTVSGPIDLAAITKDEHFKWVRRKHYYPADRNPPVPAPEAPELPQGPLTIKVD